MIARKDAGRPGSTKIVQTFLWFIVAVAFLIAANPAPTRADVLDVHDFQVTTGPRNPSFPPIQVAGGGLYGVAGSYIYTIDPTGQESLFTTIDPTAIGYPSTQIVADSSGNLYGGATGGPSTYGCIYKVTPAGAVSVLTTFDGNTAGYPEALVMGTDGSLYGLTDWGSNPAITNGVFFKLGLDGTFTTLHVLDGAGDGQGPTSLTVGSDGNFYGIDYSSLNQQYQIFEAGATGGFGAVYVFGSADGTTFNTTLTLGADGNLYGATSTEIFRLASGGYFTSIVPIYGSDAPSGGSVTQTADGSLYCTSEYGENNGSTSNGQILKVAAGAGYYTLLHQFQGTDGTAPVGLTASSNGTLYGVTAHGGPGGFGTVFTIDSTGSTQTVKSFGPFDGGVPQLPLTLGTDGYLYGTTARNPSFFRFSPTTGYQTISDFGSDYAYSQYSFYGPLVYGADGNLYGDTGYAIVKISTVTGAVTNYCVIDSGSVSAAGFIYAYSGGLIAGPSNTFYGLGYGSVNGTMTSFVFQVDANANVNIIASFPGYGGSSGNLVLAPDGTLYGVTLYGGDNNYGSLFKITADGTYTELHAFTNDPLDGCYPTSLTRASDGTLYGTTQFGGANSDGNVFKLGTDGTFTFLYTFSGPDGSSPEGPLVIGYDGNLYGATNGGSGFNSGTVYQLTPGGQFTLLESFTGALPGGSQPGPGLVMTPNGALYGETTFGGTYNLGTIYQVTGPNAPPVLTATSLNPSQAPAQNQDLSITISGLNFAPGMVAEWNNAVALQTTYVSATELDATIPAAVLSGASGSNSITVTNPANGQTSNPQAFTIVAPPSLIQSVELWNPTVPANSWDGGMITLTRPIESTDGPVTVTVYDPNSVAGVYPQPNVGDQVVYFYVSTWETQPVTLHVTISFQGSTATVSIPVVSPGPATSISLSGSTGANGWYTGPVSATLTATDQTSSVSATYYTIDGGAQQSYMQPFFITGDGIHTVTYWSVDNAGYTEAQNTATIDIDGTAPAVSFGTPSPAPNASGWNNSPVTVPYTAADATSGLASATPASPLSISTEGANQTVTVAATDVAGNSASIASPAVNIDMTPPSTSASPSTIGYGSSRTVTVTLTAADALSGVASTYYTVDNGPQQTYTTPFQVTGSSAHTVAYWSVDVAGNAEASKTLAVVADTTSPTTTASLSGPTGQNGWYTGAVNVTLSATDPDGPGAISATYYTVDGGAQQTYSTRFQVSGDAVHTITYWSVDKGGNVEPVNTMSIKIDATAPITATSPDGTSGGLILNPTDNLSGIAAVWYSVDSGAWYEAYGKIVVDFAEPGFYSTLQYYSVDSAGNREAIHTAVADLVPPVTKASLSGPAGLNGWYTGPVTITLSATDAHSTVLASYYTIDGGAQQTYSQPVTVSGDGKHTVTYWSTDAAGNTESANSTSINIDSMKPTVSFAAVTPAPNAAGWNNSAVSIPYTAADALSGLSSSTPPSPLSISAEGANQTVTVTATDIAGNVLTAISPAVNIDLTAPSTTESTAGSQAANGTYTSAATVTLTATDNLSGVASTYYTVDNGAQQTYSGAFTVSGNGSHSVAYWSVDKAGNAERHHSLTLVINTAPPTTTLSLSGPVGSNGWYTGAVTVALTASDPEGTGYVANTYYTIDGGAQQTYSQPFTVSGDGTHTVKYWSVDQVGNTETANTQTIKIDGTKPGLTFGAATPAPNAAGWNNASVSIPFTTSDATSGVSTVSTSAPLRFTAEGSNQSQAVTVMDNAGNSQTFISPAVNIDETAPVTTASTSGGATGANGDYTGSVTITLAATDTLSGVASTDYSIDGGAQQVYSQPFMVTGDAAHTVAYWSVDKVGNVETQHTLSLTVDSTPPATVASLSGPAGANGWYTGAVTVTLSATDNLSGVASTYYNVDGGSQQTYSAAFTVSGDGTHMVKYWSVDKAGNTETARTQPVEIDGTKPSITFGSASPAPNAAGWNNSVVSISYTAADALSGIASSTPASPVSISTEGANQTVTVTATDIAGNALSALSPAVNIDLTAPVTTESASGPTGGNGTYTSSPTVTLSATDNLSGVAATYYTLDGGAQQTYSAPFTVTGNGSHSVVYWSVDKAGNAETHHTSTLAVNTTPPTTSASLSGPAGSNGWYTGSVTVTLSATDPEGTAYVAHTYYTIDGGAQQTYTSPFAVSGDAVHTVKFWSIDQSGNSETAKSQQIKIDVTPPVFTFGTPMPAPNAAGWNNSSVSLPYIASDQTSGTASTNPSGPVTFTAEGANQTINFTAVDFAGNTRTAVSPPINIDLTAPKSAASVSGTPGSNGAYPGSASVTLSATDNLSGVASTYYSVDGGPQQTYSAPFSATSGTSHTIKYWSVDKAGNVEAANSLSLTIDSTVPTTTSSLSGPVGQNGWYTGSVTVNLSATDADGSSDIAATYYSVDGGARQTYASSFAVTGDGSHSVKYWSVDKAGNTEQANVITVKIDATAPSTTASVSGAQVTLAGSDATSGVASTYYTIDGGAQQTYTAAFTVTGAGTHTINYWSVDVAGNVESTHSTSVTVNPSPSITSISPTSAYAGGGGFTITVNGSGFVSTSTVKWNGASLTTTFVSSTQLTATVPASDIASAGSVPVSVVNPAPGGGTSNSLTFTVSSNPAPSITSLSPSTVTAGTGAFTLTVTGSGFVSTSVVKANGTALTTSYVSSTQVTASVPASTIASTGTVSITVTNPAPGGGTSGTATLTVAAATIASVTLNPTTVKYGATSTGTVTLTGPAPSAGFVVSLSSSSSKASVSTSSLTIKAGATSGTFTVSTSKVNSNTSVTITAKNGSTSKTATLTVTP